MRLILPLLLSLATVGILSADHHLSGERQYLELRTYYLNAAEDVAAIDGYMEHALLPALDRQGIGPVGVFSKAAGNEDQSPKVYVVIPYNSMEQFASMQEALDADAAYQRAASGYFAASSEDPRFERIESELLHSFAAWPRVVVPAQKTASKDRLFELRIYESHSEKNGTVKVEMFNNGEVPIFLSAGLQPVFMGRAMTGPNTPNLSYMVVFDDAAAATASWQNFRDHPDWKKLSAVEKYKGTVSKIHQTWLSPRSYSGL
jgi:hypothetical protein